MVLKWRTLSVLHAQFDGNVVAVMEEKDWTYPALSLKSYSCHLCALCLFSFAYLCWFLFCSFFLFPCIFCKKRLNKNKIGKRNDGLWRWRRRVKVSSEVTAASVWTQWRVSLLLGNSWCSVQSAASHCSITAVSVGQHGGNLCFSQQNTFSLKWERDIWC